MRVYHLTWGKPWAKSFWREPRLIYSLFCGRVSQRALQQLKNGFANRTKNNWVNSISRFFAQALNDYFRKGEPVSQAASWCAQKRILAGQKFANFNPWAMEQRRQKDARHGSSKKWRKVDTIFTWAFGPLKLRMSLLKLPRPCKFYFRNWRMLSAILARPDGLRKFLRISLFSCA